MAIRVYVNATIHPMMSLALFTTKSETKSEIWSKSCNTKLKQEKLIVAKKLDK